MNRDNRQDYLNWFLLSLFYAYQYLLRVYPSTFTDNIRATFNFSAHEFATLSTYCIFIYSCMQIPFGILLDRLNVRKLILISFGLCLIGQFLFTHTSSIICAQWGRVLIGVGAAPAFMSTVKMVSDTFSDKLCGIFIGITCTLGTIIVILGNGLLKYICYLTNDWQKALWFLNSIGVILFIICYFALPKSKVAKTQDSGTNFWETFLSVVTNYRIFLYALLTIGTCAVVTTLSDLWGNTLLITKYHLSDVQAVFYNQFMFAGFLIGALVVPMLFNGKQSLRGVRVCCVTLIALFSIIIYGPSQLPSIILQAVLFALGFFACGDILCFALAAQLSTPKTSGLIVGWVNTINMLGLTLLQYLVAYSLDKHWSGAVNANGLRLYEASNYELALGVLLNTVILALCIACLMRSRSIKGK